MKVDMCLYTIFPYEVIFGTCNDAIISNIKSIRYKGIDIEAEQINTSIYRIRRILSSNTSIFLNPAYQPGTIIEINDNNSL